jgi:hypothetical protein
MSFAEAAFHEKREVSKAYGSPSTSEDMGRLFSLDGRVFSDNGRAMLPDTLKCIMHLRFDPKLWMKSQ